MKNESAAVANSFQIPGLATIATELTVIVPTFNEAQNVRPLVDAIAAILTDVEYELIFVDDNSPDGTARVAKEIARTDPRVRCLHRIGRRGLSSAVVEGALASSANFVAVIDGDMQHDERLLREMVQVLRDQDVDLVIGSRYVIGGGLGNWSSSRARMSSLAGKLSRLVLREQRIADPMSGFFMTRRETFDRAVAHLSIEGFKILLDYVASSPTKLRIAELPYEFRNRLHGESKLDSLVLWEYGMLLLDKLFGRFIPPRFILFGVVGATGVAVHFVTLLVLMHWLGVEFLTAQVVATLFAMTSNFQFNNLLTYRDKRLSGLRWIRGLLSFYAVCGIGALANVGIADALFNGAYQWWIAAGAGILVGTVFNFVLTSVFTWKKR